MSNQEKYLRNGFALFSIITSFMFVYYAVTIYTSGTASESLKLFAYVAGGYGLMNTYILSWAWRSQTSWTLPANTVISVTFFGVFLMDILRNDPRPQQFGVLIGLAAVLALNWFTIKKLLQKENS